MCDFTIVYDWREKKPWSFDGAKEVELTTGDYSIESLEHVVCLDRKASANELSNNLISKDWDRFRAELERMQDFEHRYIVCEFPLSNVLAYPYKESLPPFVKKRIKVRGPFLMKRIAEIQSTYNVNIIFCANAKEASTYAEALLKAIAAEYQQENPLPCG